MIILKNTINNGYDIVYEGIPMVVKIPGEINVNEELTHEHDTEINSINNHYEHEISGDINLNFDHLLHEVTFMLPAYNEELSIGNLINKFGRYDQSKILVVDNNSHDKTVQIAVNAGADVVHERKQGKGNAVKKGFNTIDSKFIVMLDADDTYDPVDAVDLLKPLMEDRADVVLGSRLRGKREPGAISKFNLLGNHLLSLCATVLHSKVSDVCTGYWAFNNNAVNHLLKEGIESEGFEIEAEMFSKISSSDLRVSEVPIQYKKRLDETKLNSVVDGFKIFIKLIFYWFNQNIFRKIGPITPQKPKSGLKPVNLAMKKTDKSHLKYNYKRLMSFIWSLKR
jgi:glycosyltransferase involved in cell wall biosynthesis